MKRDRARIEIIAIAAFVMCALLFVSVYGRRHVVYAVPSVADIPAPHYAYDRWKAAGLHGRVLFLFDRHLNAQPGNGEPAGTTNYVLSAAREGMIRSIYHFVPDAAWPEVEHGLAGYPLVSHRGSMYRMIIDEGIPVHILRQSDLPALSEPVVVNINGEIWGEAERVTLAELMRSRRNRSDLITVSGAVSEEGRRALTELLHD